MSTEAPPDEAAPSASSPEPARRRRRLGPWLVAPVAVVVGLLVLVLSTSDPAVDRQADSPLLGKPAPAVESVDLQGEAFALGDLRGRWVVVNYFAPWCIPCRQEHPDLVSFSQRHAVAGDAVVVSVVFDDLEGTRAFFTREGGDWPVVVDPTGAIALDWGVAKVPESFLVDPDGFVVSRLVSRVSTDGLDQLLERAKAVRAGVEEP